MWQIEFNPFCCSCTSASNRNYDEVIVPDGTNKSRTISCDLVLSNDGPKPVLLGRSPEWMEKQHLRKDEVSTLGKETPMFETECVADLSRLIDEAGTVPASIVGKETSMFEIDCVADLSRLIDEAEAVTEAAAVSSVAMPPAEHPLPNGAPLVPLLQCRPTQKSSIMGPVVRAFEETVVYSGVEGTGACALRKASFIDAVEAFAVVLDKMGGNMGNYLVANTNKMRNSKAKVSEDDYMAWLFSELHVHKATGYKSYLDESAWMANLWIGWSLEFFVEFFALICSGNDTKVSGEIAYSKTLKAHHNFFQSTAFHQAMKKLPNRTQIVERLKGDAETDDVLRDIDAFVAFGREAVKYSLKVNLLLEAKLKDQRNKK